MAGTQLPLFQRKTYKGIIPLIPMELQTPSPERAILQVLPAYHQYLLDGGFSKYTPDDFTGDLKKFGMFLKEEQIKEVAEKDVQAWISHLKAPRPKEEGLSAKTISRKLTALGNFFSWLISNRVVSEKENPMYNIANFRVTSPLPEILFEEEYKKLLVAVSGDPRACLLFLLLLETGIKLEELFGLRVSYFDFSNKYAPEMYVKHVGNKERKSRKLKLPMEITIVFNDYVAAYKVDEVLFPYTQRFVRYLITDTAEKAGVKKRGERIERVLERLGLSESTWEDAQEKYLKLAKEGI